jgi:hypothetical protein
VVVVQIEQDLVNAGIIVLHSDDEDDNEEDVVESVFRRNNVSVCMFGCLFG